MRVYKRGLVEKRHTPIVDWALCEQGRPLLSGHGCVSDGVVCLQDGGEYRLQPEQTISMARVTQVVEDALAPLRQDAFDCERMRELWDVFAEYEVTHFCALGCGGTAAFDWRSAPMGAPFRGIVVAHAGDLWPRTWPPGNFNVFALWPLVPGELIACDARLVARFGPQGHAYARMGLMRGEAIDALCLREDCGALGEDAIFEWGAL